MKAVAFTAVVIAAALSVPALAQDKMDSMKGMNMPASGAQATHSATDVVKKIDAKTGAVTFAHEAVPSMNWKPMIMTFQVKDKMLLDKLAVGKQVYFDFVQASNGYVVTAVK